MTRNRSIRLGLLCTLLTVSSSTFATAALVVYEGFDMGPTAGVLVGLAGTSSVGFDAGGWGNLSGSGAVANYETAGLSIGSGSTTLQTVGGNAYVGSTFTQVAAISRGLNVSTTGTIWGSFLASRAVDAASDRDVLELLVNQTAAPAGHDNNAEFVIAAEEYESHLGGVRGKSNPVFPSYSTGSAISDNTSYLVLFKATNLGGNSGSAEVATWILTSAQFDNFKPGGLTETEINSASTGTNPTDVLQRKSLTYTPGGNYPRFTTADLLMMQVFYGLHARYDELRVSNATSGGLDEVTPIPEPTSVAMAAIGLAWFCLQLRRRMTRG